MRFRGCVGRRGNPTIAAGNSPLPLPGLLGPDLRAAAGTGPAAAAPAPAPAPHRACRASGPRRRSCPPPGPPPPPGGRTCGDRTRMDLADRDVHSDTGRQTDDLAGGPEGGLSRCAPARASESGPAV
jgi:hypothetical protein